MRLLLTFLGLALLATTPANAQTRLPDREPSAGSPWCREVIEGYVRCSYRPRHGRTAFFFYNRHQMIELRSGRGHYVVHYNARGCYVRRYPLGSRIAIDRFCNARLVSGGRAHNLGKVCYIRRVTSPPRCR